jgi:glycine/D-amino acid oxidase-like deaminating enzyme
MTAGAKSIPTVPASYWAATAAPRLELPVLEGSKSVDVCVVGGGFAGLSTALHLASAGISTVVVEAAEPGWGASGRNGGQIIPGFKAERSELVQRVGEERAERLFAWSGTFVDTTLDIIKRHNIDCQAGRPGWIQPAHSFKALSDFQRRIEEWQSRGADVSSLGQNETAELLGTKWYKGAVLDRRGGRLHPLSYARGLARAAIAVGVSIYGKSPVRKVTRAHSRWKVDTEIGSVIADKVIFCTNAYSSEFSRIWPKMAASIVPVLSYMVATQPLSASQREAILPEGHTAADLKRLTNHFRVEPDGRFLFGGRGGLAEGNDRANSSHVVAKLHELFPRLKDVPLEFFWSGKVALTMDHLPHLHELAPGAWAALGCNGRGVGMCSALGPVLARLMMDGDPQDCPVPMTTLRAIPFHGMRLPAMHAAVWWKGMKDKYDHRALESGSQ